MCFLKNSYGRWLFIRRFLVYILQQRLPSNFNFPVWWFSESPSTKNICFKCLKCSLFRCKMLSSNLGKWSQKIQLKKSYGGRLYILRMKVIVFEGIVLRKQVFVFEDESYRFEDESYRFELSFFGCKLSFWGCKLPIRVPVAFAPQGRINDGFQKK